MKARKRILWVAVALLAMVLGVWFWRSLSSAGPVQVITMPDGAKLRFVGVTYGKEGVPPSMLIRIIRWLPKRPGEWLGKRMAGKIGTYIEPVKLAQPRLFLWFKRVDSQPQSQPAQILWSPPMAVLADAQAQEGGDQAAYFNPFATWSSVDFGLIPRRSRTITCFFYRSAYGEDAQTPSAKVTFPNPLSGHFPVWHPEPVTAAKKSGSLEVQLLEQVAGGSAHMEAGASGNWITRITPAAGGGTIQTRFYFSYRTVAATDEQWILHSLELSDATGNRLTAEANHRDLGVGYPWPITNRAAEWIDYGGNFGGALWLDEPAWRLALEFKHSHGMGSNEVATIGNISIPAIGTTNKMPVTVVVNGHKIMLGDFERRANVPRNLLGVPNGTKLTTLTLDIRGPQKGLAFDVLQATTDGGPANENYLYGPPGEPYVLSFWSIPTNATRMDLTVALQTTRTVEFFVKPSGQTRPGYDLPEYWR